VPVRLRQAPVAGHPVLPEQVTGVAQGRRGGPVVGDRLGEPAEFEQDGAPLGQRAGAGDAVEDAQRGVDLGEGVARAAALDQGRREGHLGLGRQFGRLRAPAEPDGLAQVGDGAAHVAAVAQRQAPGPLGDRAGRRVAFAPGPCRQVRRQGDRPSRLGLGQPEGLPCRVGGREPVHDYQA
jgi:hypothetical protein